MDALPTLTTEMVIVMAIVVFAIFVFVTELLRVDVAALLIMTLLGVLIFIPGLQDLLTCPWRFDIHPLGRASGIV